MPDKLSTVDLTTENGWVKFDKSYKNPTNGRIHYRFNCSIFPMYCTTKKECHKVNIGEKYHIAFFEVISDERGKTIDYLYLGSKQQHPHKDPATNYLCIGKFRHVPISREIMPMLLCCILTYDQGDCFTLPTLLEEVNNA